MSDRLEAVASVGRMSRVTRSRSCAAATVLVGLVVVVTMTITACIPQNRGAAGEVSDKSGAAREVSKPPVFPSAGPVSPQLLVAGLTYDLTSVDTDLNLWVPPNKQAQCAAQKIVDTIGAERLSDLGFRPATAGASLNDINLSVEEKNAVAAQFASCVDMTQAVAAILMGDGRRMPAKAATCVALGLASKNLLQPFANAWAFGQAVDPFADNGALANGLLAYSNVCISDSAFTYSGVVLPGDEQLNDQDQRNSVSTTIQTSQSGDGLLGSGTTAPTPNP